MVITDNHHQLASQTGISQVKASFDLTKADKNPPNIILFQILSDDELTNIINSSAKNIIRFILEEETRIDTLQLLYTLWQDSIWNEIPLTYNAPYWQGQIPVLSNSLYSLRLFVSDTSQNYIDYLMAPAFLIDNSTNIGIQTSDNDLSNNQEIQLYTVHPNPFNSYTTISFFIPDHLTHRVELSIFDILGRRVKLLLNGNLSRGNHSLRWDGKNQFKKSVSTGIYFIVLKGGDKLLRQTVLLVR